ncbi:MAG: nucleotidyltransferase family protein [Patescibacteria group bacterium]
MILVNMSNTIVNIQKTILPLLRREGVLRSAIFGSFARGEENENSDVDILVQFPSGKSLLDLVSLEHELENALGRKVDVVTYGSVNPRLKEYIDRDAIQIL